MNGKLFAVHVQYTSSKLFSASRITLRRLEIVLYQLIGTQPITTVALRSFHLEIQIILISYEKLLLRNFNAFQKTFSSQNLQKWLKVKADVDYFSQWSTSMLCFLFCAFLQKIRLPRLRLASGQLAIGPSTLLLTRRT